MRSLLCKMKFNAKKFTKMSLTIFLIALVSIFIVGFSLKTNPIATDNLNSTINNSLNNQTQNNNNNNNNNSGNQNGFTSQEVSKHNAFSNCWVIVNNKVYDVTSYVSSHPGGVMAITNYCGTDMTSAFEMQHSNSGRANSILDTLYKGNLI